MRGALLVATLGASAVLGAACSGSGGGNGTLDGLVVAAANGAPIAGATVEVLGARTFTSDAAGRFGPTGVGAGGYGMVARKDGFHTLQSNVVVEDGENHLHVEMIECLQPFDAAPGCTPTSTPTPVPKPTPNLIADYAGANLFNDYMGVGDEPNWTSATFVHPNATGQVELADGVAGYDVAWTECWADAAGNTQTNAGQPRTAIDHCEVRWYGDGEGQVFNDAVAVLRVNDYTLWTDGALLDVANPAVDFTYYEGTIVNAFGGFNVAGTYVATTGSIVLVDAGYYNDGSAASIVVLTSGGFVIPTMP